MSTTYTRKSEFAYITRLTKHGTNFVACGGAQNRVLVATRAADGGITYQGASADLGAEPLDVVSDGTPTNYFVSTENGVYKLSVAASPAISDTFTFKTGGYRWLVYTAEGKIIAPLEGGGIRMLSTAGVTLQDLRFGGTATMAIRNGAYLYVFDGAKGKLHTISITATTLTWEGSVNAPNCRDILRAAIDGTNLYCLNRRRLVRFSIATATAPTFAQDYGLQSIDYADIVRIATDKLWIGFAESSDHVTGPFYSGGPQVGVWDSSNAELQTAPILWAVHSSFPVLASAGTWSTHLPAAPVITSSLTPSVTELTAFNYTITTTGSRPVTFSSPDLPAWATLNALTGVITGTAPAASTVNFDIVATNEGGSTTETVSLTIDAALSDFVDVSVNGPIYDMVVSGDKLYVVGYFTSVSDSGGANACNCVARLDLTTRQWDNWFPNANNTVHAVALDGTYVYLGGDFTQLQATARNYIGRVAISDATLDATWNPNANGQIRCLDVGAATVWAGGLFTTIGGGSRNRLAGLSPSGAGALTSWALLDDVGSALTSVSFSSVLKVKEASGVLHYAGQFYYSDNLGSMMATDYGQASVSTGNAVAMAYGFSTEPTGMSVTATGAYISGALLQFRVLPADTNDGTRNGAAFLTSAAKGAFDADLYTEASCILEDASGDVFIGGTFSGAGGAPSTEKHLARFDNTGTPDGTFLPGLSLGGAGDVKTIARYGSWIIAGGNWTATIGGETHDYFVILNATTGALI